MVLGSGPDRQCEAPPFTLGIIIPLGQVHECTALGHIFANLPGDRRDVRVPRPLRVLRMAILTGT